MEVKSIEIIPATEADKDLPTYDHTKLSNINTCPTWGIVRYSLHKKMPGAGRQLAPEAGIAFHQATSAVRLYQLFHSDGHKELAIFHGYRIFGDKRFEDTRKWLEAQENRSNLINFAIEILNSSGYYDDPRDNKRTMTNLEECAIAYIDKWDMKRFPIWVRDANDPSSNVGIENSFDLRVTITFKDDSILAFRFTGRLDGLHWNKEKLRVVDDKTASRPDDNWLAQWILSHQITGYWIAATVFTGRTVEEAEVIGIRLPLGKDFATGIRREVVPRYPHMREDWVTWAVHSASMDKLYVDDIVNAPMYTHSCNRYFSTCAMLPYCATPREDRAEVLEEMETSEWSPLE